MKLFKTSLIMHFSTVGVCVIVAAGLDLAAQPIHSFSGFSNAGTEQRGAITPPKRSFKRGSTGPVFFVWNDIRFNQMIHPRLRRNRSVAIAFTDASFLTQSRSFGRPFVISFVALTPGRERPSLSSDHGGVNRYLTEKPTQKFDYRLPAMEPFRPFSRQVAEALVNTALNIYRMHDQRIDK